MASPESLGDYLKLPAKIDQAWWDRAEADARRLMAQRKLAAGVFIVITAQHPLVDGRRVGKEFMRRMTAGCERANHWAAQDREVTIYIPGSRHMYEGVADEISLSEAGVIFARQYGGLNAGITVLGDEVNRRYKGEVGVYNGADEAYCAANYFKDHHDLGTFEVICSAGQQRRWEMQAVANGVAPDFIAVDQAAGDFHAGRGNSDDPTIIYTRRFDPTWQGAQSFLGNLTRRQRKPPAE